MWTQKAQFSSVQSLSRVRLFATPWIAGHQASLSITNSRSLLKLMSLESVMPCSHLILCPPLLLLPLLHPPKWRASQGNQLVLVYYSSITPHTQLQASGAWVPIQWVLLCGSAWSLFDNESNRDLTSLYWDHESPQPCPDSQACLGSMNMIEKWIFPVQVTIFVQIRVAVATAIIVCACMHAPTYTWLYMCMWVQGYMWIYTVYTLRHSWFQISYCLHCLWRVSFNDSDN